MWKMDMYNSSIGRKCEKETQLYLLYFLSFKLMKLSENLGKDL